MPRQALDQFQGQDSYPPEQQSRSRQTHKIAATNRLGRVGVHGLAEDFSLEVGNEHAEWDYTRNNKLAVDVDPYKAHSLFLKFRYLVFL